MRSILFFVCASLCLTGAIACRDRSAAAIAAPTIAITEQAPSSPVGRVVGYSLVIPESFVNWKGMHVMGRNGHQGYISRRKPARQLDWVSFPTLIKKII